MVFLTRLTAECMKIAATSMKTAKGENVQLSASSYEI